MQALGKLLIIVGVCIIVVGALCIVSSKSKTPFLGRLPGDILIEKKEFTFYFPLTTCLLLSGVVSLIAWLFLRH